MNHKTIVFGAFLAGAFMPSLTVASVPQALNTNIAISHALTATALAVDDEELENNLVVDTGYQWRYKDDGLDQGTAWREPDFDDSTWSEGYSQLGAGKSGNNTVINTASPERVTFYFRTSFEAPDIQDVQELLFTIEYDDGVLVYLNGHEVIRENMPGGDVTYMTNASNRVGGAYDDVYYDFAVSPEYLVTGTNVLAVEIHSKDDKDTDVAMDLFLTFKETPDPNDPAFTVDRIEAPIAYTTEDYIYSIASFVTDADGDEQVFTKFSGPDWLTISPDGMISGRPGKENLGRNDFVVYSSDGDGVAVAKLRVLVESARELARAALPKSEDAVVFGVIPDTQGSNMGTPLKEATSIAARFISHHPDFIIHVGDLTDGNSTIGDEKLAELERLKEIFVTPLAEHGIGFYPVRGNHDSRAYLETSSGDSAWAAAFPFLFEGDTAVVDPADVPGGSQNEPNYSNFCYVYSPNDNIFFVSVDQWNGGDSDNNYINWVEDKFAEIRSGHPDAHIFAFSHSGLYAISKHPAMTDFVSTGAGPYKAAGKQYDIDGWFSGHNHIYDRSMAVDLNADNEPYLFNFTCGSASEKFYALRGRPATDQHLSRLVDSMEEEGEPIAYLLVTVTGPSVSINTYMSPDTSPIGEGIFDDWSVWDTYTYSRNGRQFTVAGGQDYTDRNIIDTAPATEGFVGTTVKIIDGINTNTRQYIPSGNLNYIFGVYRNITTGWWTRNQWYDAGDSQIVSDIVNINGMRDTSEYNRCDPYTLVLSYDAAEVSGLDLEKLSVAAFLDPNTSDASPGEWLKAVDGNLVSASLEPLMRAPESTDEVGTWGIDTDTGEVWARLDYQGDFAVGYDLAPLVDTDTDKDGLYDAWEMTYFGHLDYGSTDDPDGDGLNNLLEQDIDTNPTTIDTDGDLLSDKFELDRNMEPLAANSDFGLEVIRILRSSPSMQSAYGLYTPDSLASLAAESLMEVNESGQLMLQLQLWQSQDLQHWSDGGASQVLSIPLLDNTPHFYRWGLEPLSE